MMRRFSLFIVAAAFTLSACTCNRQPVAPTLKKLGEACATDDSCATGLCDAIPGAQAVCVKKCADGCAETEICTQLTMSRFSCAKDPRKLCNACQIDSDCPYPSDRCVVVNGEKVCGRDCAFDQNCPNGYSCRNALGTDGKAKLQQCTPTVASCACLARGDLSQPCSLTNSYGTCGGIKTCDLVSNTVTCSAHAPAVESCNGIDDNCNGNVDEIDEMKSCGVGACKRTISTCAGGVASECKPGQPIDELCNAIDDDCDGVVDNGFPVDSDPNNCGACGYKCSEHVQHATGLSCATKLCDYTACEPTWRDYDGDRTNGCEFHCDSTDLPDAPGFKDANCDGFDGEVANGIYVSVNGDDLKDGLTPTSAVKTIARGIYLAVRTPRRDVYVATGTYDEQLRLSGASGINVAGGYNASFTDRKVTYETIVQGSNPALVVDSATNISVQAITFKGSDATPLEMTAYGATIKSSNGVSLQAIEVRAGNGQPGAAGAAGAAGQPGGAGGRGGQACAQDDRGGNFATLCNFFAPTTCDGSRPAAGAGGPSGCGYPGGSGGQPSKENSTNDSVSTAPNGDVGHSAPSGDGAAGIGVSRMVTPTGAPYFGTDGSAATVAGTNGTDGSAGLLSTSGWVMTGGTPGANGNPGKGGGGGGGGAGGWLPLTGSQLGNSCQSYGSAGGGGGGGGCGGAGGQGGKGGGASIALFVTNSTITGNNCIASPGNGGNGGNGGAPGPAGSGGDPGDSFPLDGNNKATLGGHGGRGGNGTAGGAGGAGSGGSVFGIARNSASTVPDSVFSLIGTGTPGNGGVGVGTAPAGSYTPKTTF